MKKIIIWLFEKILTAEEKKLYIKNEYLRAAKEDLHLKTEIIKVKKGNLKYYLATFKTPGNEVKVDLKRHEKETEAILN